MTLAVAGKIFPCKAEIFFFSAWIARRSSMICTFDICASLVRPPTINRYPIVCYTSKSILHLRLHGGNQHFFTVIRSILDARHSVIRLHVSCKAKTLLHKAIFYSFGNPLFTTSTPPRLRGAHQIPLICECIHSFSIYRCVTVELVSVWAFCRFNPWFGLSI